LVLYGVTATANARTACAWLHAVRWHNLSQTSRYRMTSPGQMRLESTLAAIHSTVRGMH